MIVRTSAFLQNYWPHLILGTVIVCAFGIFFLWPRLGTAPWEKTGTFSEGYIEGCYDANVYLWGMGTTFDN